MTRDRLLPGPQPVDVGVIGAGRVGRAVTAAVVTDGLADAVLVHSRRTVEATALAADAADLAATQHAPTRVDGVEHVRELRACSVIVVCVRARFTNLTGSRTAGLIANAPLIAELARQLVGYDRPVLMITNPVDVMSRLFAAHSGAPVFGIGSNLDSARFRGLIAARLGVPLAEVRGSVLGGHDESAIICAHATRVHNEPVSLPVDWIRDQLIARSPSIVAGTGRTQHGPAGAALSALRKLVGLAEGHEELAVPTPRGVYLGQRLRFVAGRPWIDCPELSTTEHAGLDATERRLAAIYNRIR